MRTKTSGFTLLELMVGIAIAILALSAGLAALSLQNGMLTRQVGVGSAVSQSELALQTLEKSIRMAGTGIDPQMAFDFDYYNCVLPGTAQAMTESASCFTSPPTRDSKVSPDELVLAFRDPAYTVAAPADTRAGCSGGASTYVGKVWNVTTASTNSVTIVIKPGDTIYRGQVLQLACVDGKTYTYATVSSPQTTATSADGGSYCTTAALSLYPTITNDPFNQPGYLGAPCFSAGTARAYAVRRQRFFVRREQISTSEARTYLMLDQGLDLNNNNVLDDGDTVPIASDIEDFQVAFGTEQPGILSLTTPPTGWVRGNYVQDSNGDGVWGNDPAAAAEQLTGLATVAGSRAFTQFASATSTLAGGSQYKCTAQAANAFYQFPCLWGLLPVENSPANNIHAYRWVAWPGSIATVTLGVVARGPRLDTTTTRTESFVLPALLNRPAASTGSYPAWYQPLNMGARVRVSVSTAIHPINMATMAPFWN